MTATSTDVLFDLDTRHPMWTYQPNPLLQAHRDALRKTLARNLPRFLDRADLHVVVSFCEAVYQLSVVANSTAQTTGPAWLIGSVTLQRIAETQRLTARMNAIPAARESSRRSINVITDLAERVIAAVASST